MLLYKLEHTYTHKRFIEKMTERINLTMRKWTKCYENNTL